MGAISGHMGSRGCPGRLQEWDVIASSGFPGFQEHQKKLKMDRVECVQMNLRKLPGTSRRADVGPDVGSQDTHGVPGVHLDTFYPIHFRFLMICENHWIPRDLY